MDLSVDHAPRPETRADEDRALCEYYRTALEALQDRVGYVGCEAPYSSITRFLDRLAAIVTPRDGETLLTAVQRAVTNTKGPTPMSTVTINGTTFTVPDGSSVVVRNNTVTVNGKPLASGLTGIVEIKWDGPMGDLTSDASVRCGDVAGNVRAGNSISCDAIRGNANAGNSINCDDIGGNANAGGSIHASGYIGR
jgi:hypothetical protein